MRRAAKVDDNHREIVRALRDCGATVQDLSPVGAGCPDILVGWQGRNHLIEIKDGAKVGELTGGEVILNPKQEKAVAKESPYFRALLKKFKADAKKRKK